MDVASDASEEADQFRLDILKTLSVLPIPNKTMLIDSKVSFFFFIYNCKNFSNA